MASIDFIQKRIAGKEKEIDKLEKKLVRIRKAEASGWEDNPYYYSENDLRWTLRDLEAAKQGLEKYRADLAPRRRRQVAGMSPRSLNSWKCGSSAALSFTVKA